MLRRVAAFCRPLRPVLLLVSFPRSLSPVVGVPGLCWIPFPVRLLFLTPQLPLKQGTAFSGVGGWERGLKSEKCEPPRFFTRSHEFFLEFFDLS